MSKNKTHYEIFCKRRGYICSVVSTDPKVSNYEATLNALKQLYKEHEKHFRKVASTGRRIPAFACYGIERSGNQSNKISFLPEIDLDNDYDLPEYEEVKDQ